jgi:hypothetical protein
LFIFVIFSFSFFFQFKVVFEAVRGSGINGDIALDDVLIKEGACPSPGTGFQNILSAVGIE